MNFFLPKFSTLFCKPILESPLPPHCWWYQLSEVAPLWTSQFSPYPGEHYFLSYSHGIFFMFLCVNSLEIPLSSTRGYKCFWKSSLVRLRLFSLFDYTSIVPRLYFFIFFYIIIITFYNIHKIHTRIHFRPLSIKKIHYYCLDF